MPLPTLQDVCSWEILHRAWRKASLGKRSNPAVAAFEHRLEDYLCELSMDLRQQTWEPGAGHSFFVHEPKRRLITAAPFADRVVHHALCNIIEPVFERGFVAHSFANRVGKGTHLALDQAQRYCRTKRYVLPCDLRQYFPSIDHEILLEILYRKLPDAGIRWLCHSIVYAARGVHEAEYRMVYFPGDDLLARFRPSSLSD